MPQRLSLVILAGPAQVRDGPQPVQRPVAELLQVQDRVVGEQVTEPVPVTIVGHVPVQGDDVVEFGELGVAAPLDEIARRAGVGNATMYRHFPTRRELVIAVYAGEVSALCELGQSLLADPSRRRAVPLAARVHHPRRHEAGTATGDPG